MAKETTQHLGGIAEGRIVNTFFFFFTQKGKHVDQASSPDMV